MRESVQQGGIVAWIAAVLAGALVAAMAVGVPAAANERASERRVATATFEGRSIPADRVWEEASACVVWEDGSMECFRTEEERAAAEAERMSLEGDSLEGATLDGEMTSSSSCPARLYSSTSYLGTELSLHTRLVWHTLSYFGFNNTTSSYKLSGCSVTMRDGSFGSGSTYPGATSAWTWSATMASGWSNRVSSVWIH